jgi:hypothetical protein
VPEVTEHLLSGNGADESMPSATQWMPSQAIQLRKAPVSQRQIRELLADPGVATAKFVKSVPTVVYPLDEASLAAMPALLLAELGTFDKAMHSDKEAFLKANIGGAVALQVAFGKLDAYPIPPDQYLSNYKVVSLEEVSTKNKNDAEALSRILGDLSTIPGVCGALKMVPTDMVLASDVGFRVEDLLTIEAPWGGEHTKDAGTEAYLVVCDAPYLINLDESGLPTAYIPAATSGFPEILGEVAGERFRAENASAESNPTVQHLALTVGTTPRQELTSRAAYEMSI